MRIIFTVGLEGSGHHMMRDILQPHIKAGIVKTSMGTPWLKILHNRWDPSVPRPSLDVDRELMRQALEEEIRSGANILYMSTSWPFGQPRNVLRRPDLADLTRVLPARTRLAIIYLDRPLAECAFSVYRRGFTPDLHVAVDITKVSDAILHKDLRHMNGDRLMTTSTHLSIRQAIKYKDATIEALSKTGLEEILLRDGMKHLKEPKGLSVATPEEIAYLKENL